MRYYIKKFNLIYVERVNKKMSKKIHYTKEKKRGKRQISFEFIKTGLEGQTDHVRIDILWKASLVSGLEVHGRDLISAVGSYVVWVIV